MPYNNGSSDFILVRFWKMVVQGLYGHKGSEVGKKGRMKGDQGLEVG